MPTPTDFDKQTNDKIDDLRDRLDNPPKDPEPTPPPPPEPKPNAT